MAILPIWMALCNGLTLSDLTDLILRIKKGYTKSSYGKRIK